MNDASDGSSRLPERVLVGRIVAAHGVRGAVMIRSLSDTEGRFAAGSVLELATGAELTIERSRRHKGDWLAECAEIADRDAAEALKGRELFVDRARVPPAADGAYYHYELVGCRVIDASAGLLGEVVEVTENGGGSMLQVERTEDGRRLEVLVPLVDAYLRAVDVAAGEIRVELPPELVETCTSRS